MIASSATLAQGSAVDRTNRVPQDCHPRIARRSRPGPPCAARPHRGLPIWSGTRRHRWARPYVRRSRRVHGAPPIRQQPPRRLDEGRCLAGQQPGTELTAWEIAAEQDYRAIGLVPLPPYGGRRGSTRDRYLWPAPEAGRNPNGSDREGGSGIHRRRVGYRGRGWVFSWSHPTSLHCVGSSSSRGCLCQHDGG